MSKVRYILRNIIDNSYYMCHTEGDVVFLTKDIASAEKFKSIDVACRIVESCREEPPSYLRDEDESEVKNEVEFEVGIIEYKFLPIKK